MGRPWREEYKGGIYHVIARGNNKEYIFKDNIDKEYFLKKVKELKKGLEFKMLAYVLMDNHYHFIIQIFETPLQKLIHQVNNKYRKYYNGKYNRVGHDFQCRNK
ncbi:MAG: transposase [Lutisporaceae bacterium]